jgi:hypothetical protein
VKSIYILLPDRNNNDHEHIYKFYMKNKYIQNYKYGNSMKLWSCVWQLTDSWNLCWWTTANLHFLLVAYCGGFTAITYLLLKKTINMQDAFEEKDK